MKLKNRPIAFLCFLFSFFIAISATPGQASSGAQGDKSLAQKRSSDNIEAEKWLIKSDESLQQELWSDAIRNATVAIYFDQNLVAAFLNRSIAFIKSGKFKEAILDCNYVLNIEPDNFESLYNRGSAFYLLEEKAKALQDFQKACEIGFELSCKKFERIAGYLPAERISTLLKWSFEKFSEGNFSFAIQSLFYGQLRIRHKAVNICFDIASKSTLVHRPDYFYRRGQIHKPLACWATQLHDKQP